MRKKIAIGSASCLIVLLSGYMIPQSFHMPVAGATMKSYDQHSFWAYPWGKSVTHKGVDIFAAHGTDVTSSTPGLVVYDGSYGRGGNVVFVLGPKWRLHYYAHLDSIRTHFLAPVHATTRIGTVGTTGNAQGKPPHLHYSIQRLIPAPWRMDKSIQGWEKMFYLDPIPFLNGARS
jgi:murein DD-endopeptidase MepM/ murein hydrolase activator NlpD